MSSNVWFWQRMITPHMFHLAQALARRGHEVVYVAEEPMSAERAAMGWSAPEPDGTISVRLAPTPAAAQELAREALQSSLHVTQGLRGNGVVAAAQQEIRDRALRHIVVMETVDIRGLRGRLKPAVYASHLWRWRHDLAGILAIGADAPAWFARLAPAGLPIHPFAYFLPEPPSAPPPPPDQAAAPTFRFLFVGSLIPLKRVGLLLETLGALADYSFTLDIIGDGPLRGVLENEAERVAPGRVRFHGILPISQIDGWMAAADCLVLPSSHDGWGAVVSEAVLAGTAVVCSSACGAKALAQASPRGAVFRHDAPQELERALRAQLVAGPVLATARQRLRAWGRCAGATAGAAYLENILQAPSGASLLPPWQTHGIDDATPDREAP